MNIKFMLEGGHIPFKKHEYDGGWDLYAAEDYRIEAGERLKVNTGIRMFIPEGYVGLIWPRSGMSINKGADVLAGVIDSGYTQVLQVCLYNTNKSHYQLEYTSDGHKYILVEKGEAIDISKGDRIAQILFHKVPKVEWEEVFEVPDTERGGKGFGSSGR